MIVIFDFDGTLADSISVILRLYNQLAPSKKLPPIDEATWQKMRRMHMMEAVKFMHIKPYQIPGLLAFGRKELQKYATDIKLFPGVKEMIVELKRDGNNLYLLSTNSQKLVKQVLDANELNSQLEVLQSSPLFGKAQAVKKLCRTLNVNPQDVWMVGDELRDIQAAHRLGAHSIAVDWGLQPGDILETAHPEHVVHTPNEITKIIQASTQK